MPAIASHIHATSRHQHWNCQTSTITQALLMQDYHSAAHLSIPLPRHSPSAPSLTAAALPSAHMHPWECAHSQL